MTKELYLKYAEAIESKRGELKKALKCAANTAKSDGNLCNVLFTPNGNVYILEDVSHGNEYYEGEYMMIARFNNPWKKYAGADFDGMIDSAIKSAKDDAEHEEYMESEHEKAWQEYQEWLNS